MKQTLMAGLIALSAFGGAAQAQSFELSSGDIAADETINLRYVFNGMGCTGQNLSPSLSWTNAPVGTKSFALMVHDPDAPTGGAGFWHWVVINIPASATGLAQGVGTPEGRALAAAGARQIPTDFGTPGWGGPCPPVGDTPHRYHFTVYALNVDQLDLPANATASLAGFMVNSHALAKAELTARYGR